LIQLSQEPIDCNIQLAEAHSNTVEVSEVKQVEKITDDFTRSMPTKISEILKFDETFSEEEENKIKTTQNIFIDDTFDETLIEEEDNKMDIISSKVFELFNRSV
jgi:hypothetical protein